MEDEGPAVWQLVMAIEPKVLEIALADNDNKVN